MQGVLLDTSFLITLTDYTRANHQNAKEYYRVFIEQKVEMFLSTIVISEFQIRQKIQDLPLGNFLILPFNVDHAIACAAVAETSLARRPTGYDRATAKDDFKLLGQCQAAGISHFITDDGNCRTWINQTRSTGTWATLPVPIYVGDPFDSSFFNVSNQKSFT